jgi:hypothetical protein
MKCPNCGKESTGRFCPACGATMKPTSCRECGGKLVPGARFCTSCGTEAVAGPSRQRDRTPATDRGNLPWYIAGAVLLVLIVVLLVPMIYGGDDVPARGAAPFGADAAPGMPPPLDGTPREQADRLFNRVMTAREGGNMAEAQQFSPMAVQAYEMSEPLDDDGIYHLAAMRVVAGDTDGARAAAERILSRNPNHLLALAIAAEAMEAAGDAQTAREYHRRFLDAYESEVGRQLPEYLDHARVLPEYRAAALAGTAGAQ